MIKIQNNTPTREPLPKFLRGLKQISLLDLSWTDPALGVQDSAWWPERDVTPVYDPDTQTLDGTETLTINEAMKVVDVVKGVRDFTADELEQIHLSNLPAEITLRQGHEILIEMDLYDSVVSTIDTITPVKKRRKVENYFYRSREWKINDPTMDEMAALMEMTQQEKESLFVAASLL